MPFVLSFAEPHKSKCQTNIYFSIDAFEHSMNIDYQCILLALSFTRSCIGFYYMLLCIKNEQYILNSGRILAS